MTKNMYKLFVKSRGKVLASLISLRSVSHYSNDDKNKNNSNSLLEIDLSGPLCFEKYTKNQKIKWRELMGEAAERSQRVLKVQAAKYNIPGLSYGVAFDEKQPFSSYFGQCDVENNKLVENDTKYKLGNISMLFTAYLCFRMIQEGKIHLHTRVFPLTPKDDSTTVNSLLCHMSGLKDYNEDELFSLEMKDLIDLSRDVLVSKLNNKCIDDKNIGVYSKSKYGYHLLQCLMETVWNDESDKVSSRPYNLMLKDEISKLNSDENNPIEVDWNLNVIDKLSRHYIQDKNGSLAMDRFAPFGHKSGVWGVVSNCYLLTKFAHILNSGTKDSFNCEDYPKIISSFMAKWMFLPLKFQASYDKTSGIFTYPCIFGNVADIEGSNRSTLAYADTSSLSSYGTSCCVLVKGFQPPAKCQIPADKCEKNQAILLRQQSELENVECESSKDVMNKNVTVSVICNVSQVPLFEAANKISGYYEDAYKKFIKFSANISPQWSAATDENAAKIVDELHNLTAKRE